MARRRIKRTSTIKHHSKRRKCTAKKKHSKKSSTAKKHLKVEVKVHHKY